MTLEMSLNDLEQLLAVKLIDDEEWEELVINGVKISSNIKEMRCLKCDGTGYVNAKISHAFLGEITEVTFKTECHMCGGSGELEPMIKKIGKE